MGHSEVDGPNSGYAALLLEQYLDNPGSVPEEWRDLFESDPSAVLATQPGLARLLELAGNGASVPPAPVVSPPASPPAPASPPPTPAAAPDEELLGGVAAAMALVKAIRTHGHLNARLDPLGVEPPGDPALEPLRLTPKLTPELQARIPASLLRLHVEGETLADALPRLLATYTGTIAYEIAPLRSRGARLAAAGDRVGPLPQDADARRARPAPRAVEPGRGDGALPPPSLPRAETVLRRRPRRDDPDARRGDRPRSGGGRARSRHRNGTPRPPQRPRARRRPAVRRRPPRVRRRADDRSGRLERRGRQRRREVPPRSAGHSLDAGRRHHDHARLQPEPSGGRQPRRRGSHPRRADRPILARGLRRPERRAADPSPR